MGRIPTTVGLIPGAGLVARFANLVIFLHGESPSTDRILGAAETAASAPDPGVAIAQRLAATVFSSGSAQPPAFGVVAPTAGGILILLRGPVTAAVDGPEGARTLSGERAMTWADEIVRNPVRRLTVIAEGVGGEIAHTDLRAGVVAGGGFVLHAPVSGLGAARLREAARNPAAEAGAKSAPEPTPKAAAEAMPNAPSKAMPNAPSKAMPNAPSKAMPNAPSKAMPNAPSKAMPNAPSKAMPNAPSKAMPNAPSEAMPSASSGAAPSAAAEEAPIPATTRRAPTPTPSHTRFSGPTPASGSGRGQPVSPTPESPAEAGAANPRNAATTPAPGSRLAGGSGSDRPGGVLDKRVRIEAQVDSGPATRATPAETRRAPATGPEHAHGPRAAGPDLSKRPAPDADSGAARRRADRPDPADQPPTAAYSPGAEALEESAPRGRGAPPPTTAAEAAVAGALTGAEGAVYPLDRPYVIGRDPMIDEAVRRAVASPIVIARDRHVSRVHARVFIENGLV
ncbi:FHA domain-containing protein [Nocardia seriolae]|uniref:FHA domain-containing protein n=1 Tax=Nocardia seriolae TaxID=37332 RepID=UPI0015FE6E2C|nr:FHA domain-containing protein [Nocardia seriolae]